MFIVYHGNSQRTSVSFSIKISVLSDLYDTRLWQIDVKGTND